mgnify:CR=1 FL=1
MLFLQLRANSKTILENEKRKSGKSPEPTSHSFRADDYDGGYKNKSRRKKHKKRHKYTKKIKKQPKKKQSKKNKQIKKHKKTIKT